MSTYQHLPGVLTYETDFDTSFTFGYDSTTLGTVNFTATDAFAFGPVGAADPGTLAKELGDAVDALAGVTLVDASWWTTSPATGGVLYHPGWYLEFTIAATATTAWFQGSGGDDLRDLGMRKASAATKWFAYEVTTGGGSSTAKFASNGYSLGIWAPGVPARFVDDTEEFVRVTRSPFSPAAVTRVKLGEVVRMATEYEHVPVAHLSTTQRTIQALQDRAGIYSLVLDAERNGTLEQLVQAASTGAAMQFFTSDTARYDVEIESDPLSTGALWQPTSAGGALGTVAIQLVQV